MERINIVVGDFENAFEKHRETLKRSPNTIGILCHAAKRAYYDLVTSHDYEDLHPAERLDYIFRQAGLMSLDCREIVDYYHTVDEQLGLNDLRKREKCATVIDFAAALIATLLALNVQLPANYWLGLVFILYYREPNNGRRY